jgi:hypothetical protein
MSSAKTVVGLIGALVPIAYCGGLVWYFTQGNELTGPVGQGLGPTVLGLGAVGLLFCIPLVFKLMKLAAPARPDPNKPRDGADEEEAGSGFDADAALARYLARKAAAGGEVPVAAAAPAPVVAAPRPGFGRKLG